MNSKSHKRFSEFLNNPRVLESPEEFLGPNFEAVLNFWMILDELTKDQWETIYSRYVDFRDNHHSDWDKAVNEAIEASIETIGAELANIVESANGLAWAAWVVYCWAAFYATREIIGMHLILEQQKPLTFFEMFLNVL